MPPKSSSKLSTDEVTASTSAAAAGISSTTSVTKVKQSIAIGPAAKEFTSIFGRLDIACGAKKELCRGANEELLL